jgi:predicted amidophosphoribosyltransferase
MKIIMAVRKSIANLPGCSHCGAAVHHIDARFCSHCGASVIESQSALPAWQRPVPAKYSHVPMPRIALSCPECGEPMRFGFRKVCRRCGAELVMVPRLFHPYHMRVYVKGRVRCWRSWRLKYAGALPFFSSWTWFCAR